MKRILGAMLILAASTMIVNASKKIVINLSTQTAAAYENGKELFSGRISSGTAKRPTPVGNFRVLEKDKWHKSSSWPKPNGGAKMHYMLRLTNYGIAMHLGYVPNYPASHGCVRLENGFAQKMYQWARVGTRVKVTGHGPRRVNRTPRIATKKQTSKMPVIGQNRAVKPSTVNYDSLNVLNGKVQKRTKRRTLADAMRSPKKQVPRDPLKTLTNR